MNAINVNS